MKNDINLPLELSTLSIDQFISSLNDHTTDIEQLLGNGIKSYKEGFDFGYQEGVKVAEKKYKKARNEVINEFFNNFSEIISTLVTLYQRNDINFTNLILSPFSIKRVNVVFVSDPSIYFDKEKMDYARQLSSFIEFKSKSTTDMPQIYISFMLDFESLDKDLMEVDGYKWFFNLNEQVSEE